MTAYPARVTELRPRFDPDRHPPSSPLAREDAEDEPEPAPQPGRDAAGEEDRTSVQS